MRRTSAAGPSPGGGPDRVHHLRPLGWGSARLLHLPALVPPHGPEEREGREPLRLGAPGAWGRWEEKGSRTRLLLSLELNHRLLDGVHVGRFYEALNRWMEGL